MHASTVGPSTPLFPNAPDPMRDGCGGTSRSGFGRGTATKEDRYAPDHSRGDPVPTAAPLNMSDVLP
jgi:hypothetical protein